MLALRLRGMRFAAVGIASAVVYAVWVVWVPLLPTNLYVPLLDLGKITGYTWPSAFTYLGIVSALFALYAVGYLLVRRGAASTTAVFVFAAIFSVELLGAYPATAVDVFGYIAHGRLLAVHNVNPFVTPPNAYASDAILPFLAFPGEPSQYGPAWVLLGGAIALIGKANLLVEMLLYKGVAAAAHLAGGWLALTIAQNLGASACRARAGAFLYVWNPLLLWEMVGNAHNDGLMMLGGFLAVWLLARRVDRLSLPALAVGALVKIPIAVVAPLVCILVAKRRVVIALESLCLALVLAGVIYRPFWEGTQTLTALRRTDLFTASLGSVLRLSLEPSLGLATASDIARTVSLGAFALVLLVCLAMALLRRPNPRELLTLAYAVMLAGTLLATTWFQAWYVVWPFAFAAALPDARRHLEVALLSLGGLLQYFVFIYLWVIGVFPPYETLELQATAYAAIIGPFLCGIIVARLGTLSRVSFHAKETVRAN